ncbi:MAG: TRAP transporter small permease [Rhodobacteraceae bacterium]|nr:TRAP transporter small permease [Paracoccaceae bacterium]
MRRILSFADRGVGLVIDALGMVAGAVIGAMALTISAEVILRAFGYRGFGWTLEMAEYGLLVVGFLAAPWVLRHGDHIRVDVVLRSVNEVWFGRLIVLANVIAGATCVVLAWYGAQAAFEAWGRGSLLFKHFRMPQWIILSIMPLGTALLAWEFLARSLRRLAGEHIAGEGSGGPAL